MRTIRPITEKLFQEQLKAKDEQIAELIDIIKIQAESSNEPYNETACHKNYPTRKATSPPINRLIIKAGGQVS